VNAEHTEPDPLAPTSELPPITSTLRLRIGQEEAHYGGNLVEGARVLKLFGDVITEIAILTDGDEGLFVGYESVHFLAPVYAGDFLEVTGTVTRIGRTSRTVTFEARKVIAARYDINPSAADALTQPMVVCRAVGTTVVKQSQSRSTALRPHGDGRATARGNQPRREAIVHATV
jgi:3-aminobutyryl-CoA ammonia-lyase